jgi:hypothetical protein
MIKEAENVCDQSADAAKTARAITCGNFVKEALTRLSQDERGEVKTEFGKFGDLLDAAKTKPHEAPNRINDVAVPCGRTATANC